MLGGQVQHSFLGICLGICSLEYLSFSFYYTVGLVYASLASGVQALPSSHLGQAARWILLQCHSYSMVMCCMNMVLVHGLVRESMADGTCPHGIDLG